MSKTETLKKQVVQLEGKCVKAKADLQSTMTEVEGMTSALGDLVIKGKNTAKAENDLANLKARRDGVQDAVTKLEALLGETRSELAQSEKDDLSVELTAEIDAVKAEMYQAGQELVEMAADAEKWQERLNKVRDRAHIGGLESIQGDSDHVRNLWPFVTVKGIAHKFSGRIAFREDRRSQLDLLADDQGA